MRSSTAPLTLAIVFSLAACSSAAADEPSEAQMREAALFSINHPVDGSQTEPIAIKFFKKEGCDAPTPAGYSCHFDWQVSSANLGASIYNDISSAVFYRDVKSGQWTMRPPF